MSSRVAHSAVQWQMSWYASVRELRLRSVRPVCRFEGVAGKFTQHDFGEIRVCRGETGELAWQLGRSDQEAAS